MNVREKFRRKKRIKGKRRAILLIILFLLAGLIGLVSYAAMQMMQAADESYHDLEREKSEFREDVVNINDDPVSILLMGVDNVVEEENGRADALIVATLNPNLNNLKLVSIPRDTLVELAGRETEEKINHAYSYGEEEMTIETVENFLEIPIDYYATVSFDAFKNMVDILGGIIVDVPFDFIEDSDDEVPEQLQFYEGEMELDGRHALAYVRMRYEDPLGDIGRNERQQQVIEAMIDEVASVGIVTKIDNIADEIGNNIKTNLKTREGIAFLRENLDFSSIVIDRLPLETSAARINSVSYQIAEEESLEKVQVELQEHLEITK